MTSARSDAGFTLVELLLAVAILGIVILPLSAGIILGLRTADSTTNRYAGSNDAQILSRYLPPDVQSANSGRVNSFTACTGTSSNRKLQLTVNTNATDARTIMYWVQGPLADGRYELVRSVWINATGTCTGGQPTRSTVVVRNIANPNNVSANIVAGGFAMSVTIAPGQNEQTGYSFTVSGRQRAAA